MASVWSKIGRWLDNLLGGSGQPPGVDQARIDEAIAMIQSAVDQEEAEREVRKLRVSELSDERRKVLAERLARLLKQKEEMPKD